MTNSLLAGARPRPRVALTPRSSSSDAEDAAFLASSYGLTPDPWQEDVLDGWLGRRRDGKWSASTCGLAVPRQNGKNGAIEVRELFGMVGLGERFLHTAHEVKTARKAFLRIASFFENARTPELAALVKYIRKTNGQEAVVLTNGGSVEFIARSKGSGRGYTVDVLVCDEAQDLTDEELAALLPTISAAPSGNPQVILTGTPPDPSRGQLGEVFTRVRRDGELGRDRRLAWVDYGVKDGPLPDVTNNDTVVATNPAVHTRLSMREVERERALMSPETFARERFGWWGDPASQTEAIFGAGNWVACRLPEGAEIPAPAAIGVAASFDQAWGSIGAAGLHGDGRTHLGAVERKRGTAWIVNEAKRIQDVYSCPVVVDDKGPAADLVDALEASGVRVTRAKLTDYLDACASLFRMVQEHEVTHAGTDELETAVAGANWRTVGDRRAFGRKKTTTDVAMLEAVALAAWATSDRYDVLDSIF